MDTPNILSVHSFCFEGLLQLKFWHMLFRYCIHYLFWECKADLCFMYTTDGNQDLKVYEAVQPGLLVAEPYSWKSLVTGQPILRIRTSGVRSAVLSLPPG